MPEQEIAPFAVVIVDFPHADLPVTSLRPAIVLADPGGSDVVLAFVTTRNRDGEAFTIFLGPGDAEFAETGLRAPSTIRLARIATVQRDHIRRVIGRAGPQTTASVRRELASMFGI